MSVLGTMFQSPPVSILAVDPSLTSTGYCYKYGDQFCVGTLKPKLRGVQRLYYLRSSIHRIIASNDFDCVVVEGYAMGATNSRVFDIGEWGGILKLISYEYVGRILVIPPTSMKKFVTGKGNASKEEVMSAVGDRWEIPFSCHDEADAIALYYTAQAYYLPFREKRMLGEGMRDCLSKCTQEVNSKRFQPFTDA